MNEKVILTLKKKWQIEQSKKRLKSNKIQYQKKLNNFRESFSDAFNHLKNFWVFFKQFQLIYEISKLTKRLYQSKGNE